MVFLVTLAIHILRTLIHPREALVIENFALRQQVIALKKKGPRPPIIKWRQSALGRKRQFAQILRTSATSIQRT